MYSGIFDNYSTEMPAINLLKCHGSINWKEQKKNGQRSRVLIESKFENFKKINTLLNGVMEEINKSIKDEGLLFEDTPILDIQSIVSLIDEEYNDCSISILNRIGKKINTILLPILSEIDTLQIVFPTKRKFQTTLIEEQYFNILRLLSYELEKEQSVLIVFGFSFFDEHITDIVQRSLNNPSLLVVIFCYTDASKSEIISRFNFSETTVPNNVIFIQPNDFLNERIEKEKFDIENHLQKTCIHFDDYVEIYDSKIKVRKIPTENEFGIKIDVETPTIDFYSFNELLGENLSNRYISNFNLEVEIDE